MDFNGDGEVSEREFVGPREVFERIDANRDGGITAQEAEAAGAALKEARATSK
jgi:hypothetical protein